MSPIAVAALTVSITLLDGSGHQVPKSKPAPARPAAPAPLPSPPLLMATVTDDKGVAIDVEDPKARYGYNPDGRLTDPPMRDVAILSLILREREGRIETTDRVEMPFSALQRVAFRTKEHALEVDRRDGTGVRVSAARGPDATRDVAWIIAETDATGAVIRKRGVHRYAIGTFMEDGKVLDAAMVRQLELFGFLGAARTSAGQIGRFFIADHEVRLIEFKR